MLRITVEILPHGNEARARKLGTMTIANDATGTATVGNYVGTLHAEYTPPGGRRGVITGFRRRRQSVWSLVGAFLKLWGHTKHIRATDAEDAPLLLEPPVTPVPSGLRTKLVLTPDRPADSTTTRQLFP